MAVTEQSGLRSTSTGANITISASAQAGDLAVICQQATSFGAAPSAVTPSGFTQVATNTQSSGGFGLRCHVSFKLLVGGEGAVTGMDGGTNDRKQCFIFRSSLGALVAAASGMTWNAPAGGTGAPTPQTITSSGGMGAILALAFAASDGSVDFAGSTPWDAEIMFSDNNIGTAWRIMTSPADHTADADDNGDFNMLFSGYFNLTEAAAAGIPKAMHHYKSMQAA